MRLFELLASTIEDHLRSRGLDPKKINVIVDRESDRAVFLLYNLSGQLVGYQQYDPAGEKKNQNNPKLGKYFNYITKESPKTSKLAVWGLETLHETSRFFFITEGIFDAVKIRNAGYPVIAVLSNNPTALKSWLLALQKTSIAIVDNDAAGQSLGKLATFKYTTPSPYKDLGDMPQQEATQFIKSIIRERKLT